MMKVFFFFYCFIATCYSVKYLFIVQPNLKALQEDKMSYYTANAGDNKVHNISISQFRKKSEYILSLDANGKNYWFGEITKTWEPININVTGKFVRSHLKWRLPFAKSEDGYISLHSTQYAKTRIMFCEPIPLDQRTERANVEDNECKIRRYFSDQKCVIGFMLVDGNRLDGLLVRSKKLDDYFNYKDRKEERNVAILPLWFFDSFRFNSLTFFMTINVDKGSSDSTIYHLEKPNVKIVQLPCADSKDHQTVEFELVVHHTSDKCSPKQVYYEIFIYHNRPGNVSVHDYHKTASFDICDNSAVRFAGILKSVPTDPNSMVLLVQNHLDGEKKIDYLGNTRYHHPDHPLVEYMADKTFPYDVAGHSANLRIQRVLPRNPWYESTAETLRFDIHPLDQLDEYPKFEICVLSRENDNVCDFKLMERDGNYFYQVIPNHEKFSILIRVDGNVITRLDSHNTQGVFDVFYFRRGRNISCVFNILFNEDTTNTGESQLF